MKTPTMEDEQYEQECDAFLDAMGVAGSEGEPFDTALARLSEHHGIVVTIGLHVEAMHRHAEAVSDADSDSAVDAGTL